MFALASALSAIYLVEERALKKKKFDALAFKDKGAPLESLDRLSHRLIWVGFPIFTVALVLGAIWVSQARRERSTASSIRSPAVTWVRVTPACSSRARSTAGAAGARRG